MTLATDFAPRNVQPNVLFDLVLDSGEINFWSGPHEVQANGKTYVALPGIDGGISVQQGLEVGVYIVGCAVAANADRRDHRDKIIVVEHRHDRGIDGLDFAHLAKIMALRIAAGQFHLARADQAAILAGQPNRASAVAIDQ